VFIRGIGSYAPDRILSNNELSTIVETSDEWIFTRSGIRERHVAAPEETCADIAAQAARKAIENAGLQPADIDLVIAATVSSESPVPSVACRVQHALGIPAGTPAFDIAAACSGFVYLLQIASHMMRAGDYKNVLIVAAERLSGTVDWSDRTTCVLFGDGGGAAVLNKCDIPSVGILGNVLGGDGSKGNLLSVRPRPSPPPPPAGGLPTGTHVISMSGKEIFRNAVRVMSQACRSVLEKCGISAEEIALIVPHQANIRIIEAIAGELKLPLDRFKINLERYGNTSAASIPLALDEAWREGRVRHGDLLLLVAFGGGFTWGATLVRWHAPDASATPATA
jgi:3-oxoacyl-[acyl-carrier-protein] synthase-3